MVIEGSKYLPTPINSASRRAPFVSFASAVHPETAAVIGEETALSVVPAGPGEVLQETVAKTNIGAAHPRRFMRSFCHGKHQRYYPGG